jgi:hypothetical protein
VTGLFCAPGLPQSQNVSPLRNTSTA